MARKGEVTKIIDGDIFKTASRKNPVRLANVDAPEKGQPGSAKATEALRKIIKGFVLNFKGGNKKWNIV